MIFNENVSISIGSKKIMVSSDILINKNTKYCIVGANGVGKTTLLNYIHDKIKDCHNTIYITQTESIQGTMTIYEYMSKSNEKLHLDYMRYLELEKEITANSDSNVHDEYIKYIELSKDYLKYKSKIHKILNGMGFHDDSLLVNILSGGNQTKLSLCKALLLEPEVLLADEPTNNLDLKNIIWLEDYLSNYKNTLILISHNIDFIDNVTDNIYYFFNIDPENPQVFMNTGGYNKYSETFTIKKNAYVKNYEKYHKQLALLKKSNDKKEYEKFIKKNTIGGRPSRDYDISIKFNLNGDVKYLTQDIYSNVISFNNVNFGYVTNANTNANTNTNTNTNANTNTILENVEIGFGMTSRYVFVADNGAGKSTFFKLCMGELLPTQGEIIRNSKIRIGYFDQKSITMIPNSITPIAYLQNIDKSLTEQTCRNVLAKIGFKKMFEGDLFDVSKLHISDLSGGQKVRLVLTGIQILNPHVILFDEITNHVDIDTIDEFIKAVNEFTGGICIITHDRYVIENIKNYELLTLKDKHIVKFNGSFDEYCDEYCNLSTEEF